MFKKCFTHIIMVAMATFFSKLFVKNENFSNQAHFFKLFLKQELNKIYQECSTNALCILLWLPWQHNHPPPPFFCER